MTDLLATKLYFPQPRQELISRPRLTERLQMSSKQKLTLISAPAGFGKTTVVGEWIIQTQRPVAWVSLDGGDNDPVRFWAYFIAALQTLKNDLGNTALAMLKSPQPALITAILTNLINEIAAFPHPFSLVLDDYQSIRARSIQEALFFFIEHMPVQMHLVLISRTDPALPLARLRARNQLHEIRANDLRFTLEEVGEFLKRVIDIDLSPGDVAALEKRTEGWIAGLQLAALSMQGHTDVARFIDSFTGNNHYIVGYLVEEVFRQRPKGTLDFLLRTSILERMCAPLCDALLEKPNSQATLEVLERDNLFLLPLDDQHQWFRYHHLFADVLRARLQQTQPGLIPELHRRASVWFEQNNLMAEAIQHALTAKDYALAARIIEKLAPPTIVSGQIQTALGWLESLPEALMRSSPNLCLIHSAALMFTNQLDAAEARLKDGERAMSLLTGEESSQLRIVQGRLAIMRANLARIFGDLEECVAQANRSLAYLPESETYWRASPLVHAASTYLLDGEVGPAREEQALATVLPARSSGNLFTFLRSITNLARLRAAQGRLHQAAQTYRQVLEEAPGGLQGLAGSATYYFGLPYYFGLGILLYEWNDLDAAEQHLLHGIDLVRGGQTADADMITLGYACLARLRQARGDAPGALAVLADLAQIGVQRKFLPTLAARRSAEEARIRLAQGDLHAALQWVASSGLNVKDPELPFSRETEYLILTQVMIAQHREVPDHASLQEVIALLNRLLQTAEAGSRLGSVIEILSLRALALNALGDFDVARGSIFQALRLANADGFLRVFLDQGETMRALLQQTASSLEQSRAIDCPVDEIAGVLKAFSSEHIAPKQLSTIKVGGQITENEAVFTRRELEVLHLVAEGASNHDIAVSLDIAGPTVKRHISNIFDKLGVSSRTQALAQARKLGLLT